VQQLDVADADACAAAVDAAIAELGPLTYLVSNAANGTFATVEDMTVEEWDNTMAAHPRALFALARRAAPSIRENGGGAIVAISSLGSQRAFDTYAAFGSGKAAIEVLTKYLAVELGPSGIRCNCVSGGVVLTDLFKAIPEWESIAEVSAARAPLRTVMDPDDIADAVAFFCSDEAKRITGQTLVVDGGSLLPG
jgi:enoyl-[acyl-carrier protein] reductase III